MYHIISFPRVSHLQLAGPTETSSSNFTGSSPSGPVFGKQGQEGERANQSTTAANIAPSQPQSNHPPCPISVWFLLLLAPLNSFLPSLPLHWLTFSGGCPLVAGVWSWWLITFNSGQVALNGMLCFVTSVKDLSLPGTKP